MTHNPNKPVSHSGSQPINAQNLIENCTPTVISHRATEACGEDKSNSGQTFEIRIASAFDTMREDLKRTARETDTYADKMLDLLGQLEKPHLRKHAGYQIIKEHPHMNTEMFNDLLSTCSSFLDELAPRRMQEIQAGKEANQVQSARMQKSRKDIMNAAKRRLDEGREKQQLAADASELMKHYKALVMAT